MTRVLGVIDGWLDGKGDKTESIDGAQVDEEAEGLPGGDAVVLERRDEGGGAAGPELAEKETISV